jgi:hypothetical protein
LIAAGREQKQVSNQMHNRIRSLYRRATGSALRWVGFEK